MVSISAAAFVSFSLLNAMAERMLSLSVGVMLATALLHALPEAMEANQHPHRLFATLLAGLLTFFLLEKGTILHSASGKNVQPKTHSHHHCAERSGWMVLAGDALHNFTGGIMIAATFLVLAPQALPFFHFVARFSGWACCQLPVCSSRRD